MLPKARSRIAGYFRLLNNKGKDNYVDNGPILIECRTIRSVVTSVAEIETHGVFQNAKKILPIRYVLEAIWSQTKRPNTSSN